MNEIKAREHGETVYPNGVTVQGADGKMLLRTGDTVRCVAGQGPFVYEGDEQEFLTISSDGRLQLNTFGVHPAQLFVKVA
jgi:hypothetical protein